MGEMIMIKRFVADNEALKRVQTIRQQARLFVRSFVRQLVRARTDFIACPCEQRGRQGEGRGREGRKRGEVMQSFRTAKDNGLDDRCLRGKPPVEYHGFNIRFRKIFVFCVCDESLRFLDFCHTCGYSLNGLRFYADFMMEGDLGWCCELRE